MALLDNIKQSMSFSTGGGLFKTGKGELERQAKATGQSIIPKTPLGVTQLGVSSDSSKMAGTQIQKESADKFAQPKTLEEKKQKVEQAALPTDTQQQAIAKAQQIKQFGSMDTRLQDTIEKMLTPAQPAEGAPTPSTAVETKGTVAGGKSDVTTALAAFDSAVQGGNKEEANKQLAIIANSDIGISKETIDSYFAKFPDATAESLASAIANEVKISEVYPAGSPELKTAAELMGLTEADISKMTTGQFQAAVDKIEQESLQSMQYWKAVLGSPITSSAEKQQAQAQLRQLSQAGVSGAEETARLTSEEMKRAGTVVVDGKEMSLKDVLADETLKGIAKDYLALETEADKQKFRDKYGDAFAGLFPYIEKTAEVFKTAAAGREAAAGEFGKITETNKKISANASEDILKALIPDYDATKVRSGDMTTELQKTGLGQMVLAASQGDTAATALMAGLKDLTRAGAPNAEFIKSELLKLSKEDLTKLAGKPEVLTNYATLSQAASALTDPAKAGQQGDNFAKLFLNNPDASWGDLQGKFNEAYQHYKLTGNWPPGSPFAKMVNESKFGRGLLKGTQLTLKSPAELSKMVGGLLPSLAEVAGGKSPGAGATGFVPDKVKYDVLSAGSPTDIGNSIMQDLATGDHANMRVMQDIGKLSADIPLAENVLKWAQQHETKNTSGLPQGHISAFINAAKAALNTPVQAALDIHAKNIGGVNVGTLLEKYASGVSNAPNAGPGSDFDKAVQAMIVGAKHPSQAAYLTNELRKIQDAYTSYVARNKSPTASPPKSVTPFRMKSRLVG